MHYGENGILKGAEYAADKYQNKAEQEQNELAKIDDYIQNGRETVTISKEEYEKLQKKGTWELLASSTSQTAEDKNTNNLKQYSSFVLLCYDIYMNIDATTTVSYDIFSTKNCAIHANYNNGTPYVAYMKYVNDTTVSLQCCNSKTGLVELYGVY